MEARTIVAIEIASSKVKGAVAVASPDGRITVTAVEELQSVNSVRHGRVQNIKEVSAAVNEIIRKLENNPAVAPRKVQSVVLSLGGRSLTGTPATATIQFPHEIEVTDQTVNRLMAEAAKDFVGNKNIEAIMARNYYVNNVQVKPVVGTVGTSLRGDFLMLTCARETRQNLDRLKFDTVRAGNVDYVLRPTAVADVVLSDDDRQLGCVLVDFGAETTTVSIYKGGTLAFLSTIPMGSRLITKDLMAGLTLTEAAAEDFKLTLGNLGDNSDATPNATEVNNYVRARAGEIAANIVNQIELSGIGTENLGAGIILVGGGAKLPEFGNLLASQSRLALRRGTLPPFIRFTDSRKATPDNIDIAALLAAALNNPDFEGLTPVETDTAEETASDSEKTPVQTPAYPADDNEAEPERPVQEQASVRTDTSKDPARPYKTREDIDMDDIDLLKDDNDETYARRRHRDDKVRRAPGRAASIFPEEPDDSEDNKTPDEGGEENISAVQSMVRRLQEGIARFFNTHEEDEDNE